MKATRNQELVEMSMLRQGRESRLGQIPCLTVVGMGTGSQKA
jgi:hypothetical protein